MPVGRAVAKMCVPSIIGSLVMMLYSMADTYFVGLLNDPVQVSAVTLASPLLLAYNAVNNLFGVGSSSLMSRALGQQDFDRTRRASAFGLYCSIIAGICFTLTFTFFKAPFLRLLGADAETFEATSEYVLWTVQAGAVPAIVNVVLGYFVRAEGAAMHATIGTMSGCILNLILDPFFILPQFLGMGASGAGLATLIGNTVAVLYFVVLTCLKRGKTFVSIRPKDFRPSADIARDVCSVGVPASIQNLLNVTGQTILNNFAAAFGPIAVSAIGISHKIVMLPIMLGIGVSNGIMPLIGYNYSSGNRRRMREVFVYTMKIMLSAMAVLAVVYFIFPDGMMRIFIQDAEVVAYGAKMVRIASPTVLLMAVDFVAVGVFQACGLGRRALFFAVLRKVVLEIPLLFLLNRVYPLYGLPMAQPISEFILSIAAILCLRKIMRE